MHRCQGRPRLPALRTGHWISMLVALLQEQLQVPMHNNDEVAGKDSEFNVF